MTLEDFQMLKKNIGRIAALLMSVCILLCRAGAVDTYAAAAKGLPGLINANELYMRSGPGTDYENICLGDEKVILVRDQGVMLYALVDDWYFLRAEVNGTTVLGYSSGKYIKTDAEFEKITLEEFTGDATVSMPAESKYRKDKTEIVNGEGFAAQNTGDGAGTAESGNTAEETGNTGEAAGDGTAETETVTEKAKLVSKFKQTGKVTQLLNMRKTSSIDSSVLAVLEKGTKVWLVGTCINTIKQNDVNKKVRWYRIIAIVDGKPVRGYVLSDYVKLDYTETLQVSNKYGKQVLLTKAGSSTKVRTVSGKSTVKLPKGSILTVIGEKQTEDYKWLKVTAEYKGETYTGFIKSLRTDYIKNTSSTIVEYEVPKEPAATVTVEPAPADPAISGDNVNTDISDNENGKENSEGGENGTENTEAGNNEEGNTEEGNTVQPDIISNDTDDVSNPNARVIGAAALSVKLEPKYSSPALFTGDGIPVFLYTGQLISVKDRSFDSDGNLWYEITCRFNKKEYSGFITATYVETNAEAAFEGLGTEQVLSELTFEERLDKEGFPDSYREPLRLLHEQYPNWEFKAYQTGLEWSDVIAAESEVGVNLIPNTKSVEWKSLEKGAYSWKNDTFTVFDGSTWVTASKAAIEYYMDPRNFLDEKSIFQFEVLAYNPSCQKKSGVETIIRNTAMNGQSYEYKDELGKMRSISYADTFIMAAEFSGVSPLHLASRVKQEVTVGASAMSNSVTGTVSGHEGLYNYYNIGAYNSTEAGGAIANGLRFAKNGSGSTSLNMNCLIPWNNRLRSILGGAFYIGNNYINRGQNTIYLQKFNVTSTNSYWHQYMANVEAPYSEGRRVFSAYEDPAALAIVFSIPVYLNMPEQVCGIPEKAYNPNNWLKNLVLYDINGNKLPLTPTFSYTEDKEYSIIVPNTIDYIKVNTSTVSTRAKVISDGYTYPSVGSNRFVVSVKAENGDVRDYVINIVREAAEGEAAAGESEVSPTPGESTGTPAPTPEVTPATPTPSQEEPTVTPTQSQEGSADTPTPTAEVPETSPAADTPTPVPEEPAVTPVITPLPEGEHGMYRPMSEEDLMGMTPAPIEHI